jgi:glutamine synthetase
MNNKSTPRVSTYFGENNFHPARWAGPRPAHVYTKVRTVIEKGGRLDMETANIVAVAMKDWAISKGCTHYTHWFQPMTGTTAEKHDSFLAYGENGRVIEAFTGRQLIQGEPDASSFPSGGIRATFEARGYTIWDPTSPAFVVEYPHGNTLCIPSIFISYTGESLDKKAPLLRSLQALNTAAMGVLRHFRNPATQVFSTLGVEQEYFLIDHSHYRRRPDLMQTGRTLFGKAPAKHQQLEDQYFGNIPERAFHFMTELEEEAYRHGIPLKTRHNEVAPNQFEVAPVFEGVNIAVDHNQILMDMMDRIARRHDLAVLLHEKPFAHINGSGKHCNWSIATDRGENLLDPGKTPESNLQFLAFLVSTTWAVHRHAAELRASVASCSNDLRLGANEAPPAIISVFVGEMLTRVLEDLAAGRTTATRDEAWISVGIDKIPEIPRDNTDRNRTSPFAFTGSKFEFRAVGSSSTPASAVTVLNTAVADGLTHFSEQVAKRMAKKKNFTAAAVEVLREMVKSSKSIFFEGDNYSGKWQKEAERRGLPNLRTTPEALEALLDGRSVEMFTRFGIFSDRELESRHHIDMEHYIKTAAIEAEVTRDLAVTMFLPAAAKYARDLSACLSGTREALGESGPGAKSVGATLREVAGGIDRLHAAVKKLDGLSSDASALTDHRRKGRAFVGVRAQGEKVREAVDHLEGIVSDEYWPIPKYRSMLLSL